VGPPLRPDQHRTPALEGHHPAAPGRRAQPAPRAAAWSSSPSPPATAAPARCARGAPWPAPTTPAGSPSTPARVGDAAPRPASPDHHPRARHLPPACRCRRHHLPSRPRPRPAPRPLPRHAQDPPAKRPHRHRPQRPAPRRLVRPRSATQRRPTRIHVLCTPTAWRQLDTTTPTDFASRVLPPVLGTSRPGPAWQPAWRVSR